MGIQVPQECSLPGYRGLSPPPTHPPSQHLTIYSLHRTTIPRAGTVTIPFYR